MGLRYGINLTHGHLGWVVYQMRRTANLVDNSLLELDLDLHQYDFKSS